MQHGAAAELLARLPLFNGLGAEYLTAIVERCETRQFGVGQVLAAADTPAESAQLILEGEVALHDEGGRSMGQTRGPGTILDEMAMFVPTEHYPGAIAVEGGTVLEMPRHVMGQMLVEQPILAAQFAQNTRQNLVRIAQTLHELDAMLEGSSAALDALPKPEISELEDAVVSNGAVKENDQQEAAAYFGESLPGSPRAALGFLAERAAADGRDHPVDLEARQESAAGNGGLDLVARLNGPTGQANGTLQGLEHDPTAFPNLVLRQSHEGILPRVPAQDLPRHDQGDARDLTHASSAHGSSTM